MPLCWWIGLGCCLCFVRVSSTHSQVLSINPSYAIFLCVSGICFDVKNCFAAEAKAAPAALIVASISRSSFASISRSSFRSLETIEPRYLNFLTNGMFPPSTVTCKSLVSAWHLGTRFVALGRTWLRSWMICHFRQHDKKGQNASSHQRLFHNRVASLPGLWFGYEIPRLHDQHKTIYPWRIHPWSDLESNANVP